MPSDIEVEVEEEDAQIYDTNLLIDQLFYSS